MVLLVILKRLECPHGYGLPRQGLYNSVLWYQSGKHHQSGIPGGLAASIFKHVAWNPVSFALKRRNNNHSNRSLPLVSLAWRIKAISRRSKHCQKIIPTKIIFKKTLPSVVIIKKNVTEVEDLGIGWFKKDSATKWRLNCHF